MTTKRNIPYSNECLSHAAGFFDGEGCVHFDVNDSSGWKVHLGASIGNTNKEIIEYFEMTFGGRITTSLSKNPKHKSSYIWYVNESSCINFLQLIKPWILIKREQILLAEYFYTIRNTTNRAPSTDYKDEVKLINRQFRWLNRRGPRQEFDVEPIPHKTGSIWAKDYYTHLN